MEPLKSINEAFDKFTEDQITKLISTWNQHKILRIAVDFDSTIFPWNENEVSTCTYVIYLLKKAKEIGAHITLFTCRDGSLLEKAIDYCKRFNLHFDDVNPTKPFKPYFSSKLYYNILLDDKAGLGESLYIQGQWDYKCVYDPKIYDYKSMSAMQMYQAKLFDIIIYRITTTNVDGQVYEYSARQVRQWCLNNGLHPVNELYYGRAGDLYNIDPQNHWHENFIEELRKEYLEKDSILCRNKVPEEGIVIRREVTNIDVYKLKANRFLQKETQELDKGVIDIESSQE